MSNTSRQPVLEALERRTLFSSMALASSPVGAFDWVELDYRGDAVISGSIASPAGSRSFALASRSRGLTTISWRGLTGGLDPYVHVFDAKGRLRFASDAPDPQWASGRMQVSLRAGATYYVLAGGLAGTTGDFEITLDAPAPKLTPIRFRGPGRQAVRRGRIRKPGKAKYFRFLHSDLEVPELSLSPGSGADVLLTVWHEGSGLPVSASDDGSSASLGAQVDPYYYVRVSGTSGAYDLNVLPGGSIFVSPDVRRGGRGTFEDPFGSLDKARGAARAMISDGLDEDLTVYIRGGQYRLSRTVEFGVEDSPGGGHTITYMAFPGETPVFTGGKTLSPGWTHVGDGIYRARVGRGRFRQLYVNGERAQRAESDWWTIRRYEPLRVDGVVQTDEQGVALLSGRIIIRGAEMAWIDSLVGAEMHLKRKWSSHVLRITGVSDDLHPDDGTAGRDVALEFAPAETAVLQTLLERAVWDYYSFQGLPFVDTPGEWWQDGGNLYYMPQGGEDLAASEFVVPVIETLVQMTGTSDVHFEGLTFEHTSWERPGQAGFVGQQAGFYETSQTKSWGQAHHPPAGVSLRAVRGVSFTNSTFRHFGGTGLAIGAGSRDVSVDRSVISDISGNGVNIDDYSEDPWRMARLTRVVDVSVTNSRITHFGQDFLGSVGVFIGPARSVLIDHNEIAHGPYTGISMGFYSGLGVQGDMVVTNNEIHHIMAELADGGAIYATGSPLAGSRIEGNYVHDMLVSDRSTHPASAHAGIYLEPSTAGIVVAENVLDTDNPDGSTPALHIYGNHYVGKNYTSPIGHADIVDNAGPAD